MSKRRTVHPSRASARVRALLLTTVAAPLLLCCATAASAKPSKRPPTATQVIELELRELGDSERARELVVPIDGRIAGELTLLDQPGYCEASSRSASAEAELRIELRCTNPRLELESVRALALDTPTIIAELDLDEGRRLRVVATRR